MVNVNWLNPRPECLRVGDKVITECPGYKDWVVRKITHVEKHKSYGCGIRARANGGILNRHDDKWANEWIDAQWFRKATKAEITNYKEKAMPKSKKWTAEYLCWRTGGVWVSNDNWGLGDTAQHAMERLLKTEPPDIVNDVFAILVTDGDTIKIARKKPIPEPKYEWVFDDDAHDYSVV